MAEPRKLALVPIAVLIPGRGWIFFPKQVRGKLVPEAEFLKLWKEHVHSRQFPDSQTKATRKTSGARAQRA